MSTLPHGTPANSPTGDHQFNAQEALQAAGIGIWSWEIGSKDILWDKQTRRLFGSASEQPYEPFAMAADAVHPEDRALLRNAIASCTQPGAEFNCEFRVIWSADYSVRALRSRGRVAEPQPGKPLYLTGVCWDITERKAIETELKRERFLLETLMEHIPDKIYFKDIGSRFVRVSQAMSHWFGVDDTKALIGKTDFDFFSPEHAQQAFNDEQRIIRTGEPMVNQEEKETWSDGHETWVSTTKLPLKDASGQIIGTFGISRDITDRRRAEQQLSKYSGELRRRNNEFEEDLGMARELQNALMPKGYPSFPAHVGVERSALTFSHYFNPSTAISGDFFDILPLSDTMAGVFICDVMGHGMRAALVAAIVRALVGELRGAGKNPGEFLTRLNRKLHGILNQTDIPMFASASYVVIDTEHNQLRYANAGHPDPLWIRDNGGDPQVVSLDQCKRGPVLGLFEDAHYGTSRCPVQRYDKVLLFTDGVYEVENESGQLYDERNLKEAVSRRVKLPTETLCHEVLDEVQQFAADKHFNDDVCLVSVEIKHLKPQA